MTMKSEAKRESGAAVPGVSRRNFLAGGAVAAGAGFFLLGGCKKGATGAAAAAKVPASEVINVAIVGTGAEGRVLLEAAKNIPGIQFQAVCDIWDYNRQYGTNYLKKFNHPANPYADFDEMLATEKDLQAIMIAVPDHWHSPYTVASLKKGLHVYCEKMMANTVDGARAMVRAMKETGKLLQIGHQRHSNPRYIFAREHVMAKESKLLGRIVNINGQWNRAVSADLTWPKKNTMPEDMLNKYQYGNMREFRNWRWFKRYSGGPISDLGAHQIDIFSWFLGEVRPKNVMASGGKDYYPDREWYDNVMVIYEYVLPEGTVRAFYQVLTTTSAGGGYFEQFMGVDGSLKMSENPKLTRVYKEAHADAGLWDLAMQKKFIRKIEQKKKGYMDMVSDSGSGGKVDVRETADLVAYEIPVSFNKPIHQPHIENFFDAIRGKAKLNCPADYAFDHEAAVFKVNPAIEAAKRLDFEPADFEV